jgi:exosome complex exonuclease DIS3/RRP44
MQIMRQRRIERGALTLASPEVKFEIDTETHDPLDVGGFSVLPCTCYGSVFLLTSSPLFSSAIFFFLLLLTM